MTVGADTHVAGDPASCRQAARGLRALAAVTEDAHDTLGRQARTPRDEFSGEAADGYREVSSLLRDQASSTWQGAAAVAEGLEAYADTLAEVQEVMARARTVAAHYGLLHGTLVEAAPPGADDRVVRTHEVVVGHMADARDVLATAEARLRTIVADHAGGDLSTMPDDSTGPIVPSRFAESPPSLRPAWPPSAAAWPDAPEHEDPWPLPGVGPGYYDTTEPQEQEQDSPPREAPSPDGGPPDPGPRGRWAADVAEAGRVLPPESPTSAVPGAGPAVLTPAPSAPLGTLPDPLRPEPSDGWSCRVPPSEGSVAP